MDKVGPLYTRGVLPVLLLTVCSARLVAQKPIEQGELDASPALFTVMAAINAAGYDAELDAPSNSPLRALVRREVAARNPACLPELRTFLATHHQKDATAELSQFISFALSVGAPPGFEFRYRANELPPDVLDLEGFQPLIRTFYQQAGIEQLWRGSQRAFEEAIERYHRPSMDALRPAPLSARASRFT